MDKKKKSKNDGDTVQIEDFLDFVAKKRSVASKEELCLQIQSLGMHISVIRKAMSLETATLKKPLDDAKKKSKRRPLFSVLKTVLWKVACFGWTVESFSELLEYISDIVKSYFSWHFAVAMELLSLVFLICVALCDA